MLEEARNKAKLSLEVAGPALGMDRRTLSKMENGHNMPPRELFTILNMAGVYTQPELPLKFCSTMCPIGKYQGLCIEQRDLSSATLLTVSKLRQAQDERDMLIDIVSDGKIDSSEQPMFDRIMGSFKDVQHAIQSLYIATIGIKEKAASTMRAVK
ncbi:MAG: hypothetical protein H6Q69_301 [Firmicutes bacterium]|nr:hypothetical protein [Bacillota bacterium]